ncbi:MAG TPA: phasin family protein [Gammaproteobacteria bacterium]|nr:phasin family protein [Gammaproteobacteria bacterium]
MMTRIEQLTDNLKAESRTLADRAVSGLRSAGLETAELLTKSKRPVHALADTGLKLNNMAHKNVEKLLKQQVAALDDIIDGGARRLETAARARTIRTLVDGQIAALPKTRKHAVKNAREAVSHARETGDAVGDLFKDVVVDISTARKPTARKPARKKAAGRPAARKKAPGRKPAAKRKTTARKASAKRKTTARKASAKKRTSRKAA